MADVGIKTGGRTAPATRGRFARAVSRNRAGYLFLLPWLIGFFCLTLVATLASLYLSFTDYDLLTSPEWTGLENYEYAFFSDRRFGNALRVTFTYVLWSVPLKLAVASVTTSTSNPRRDLPSFVCSELLLTILSS